MSINQYQVFDLFLDGVFVFDGSMNVVYCNNVAAKLFGFRAKRLIGKKCYEHFIFDSEDLLCMKDGTIGFDGPSMYQEVDFSSSKGQSGTVQIMIQPDIWTGSSERWIVYFHDVTEEKNLAGKYLHEFSEKEKMEEKALKDEMTGLPNFRAFTQEVASQLQAALDHNMPLGLVILDVDKFKVFNDTYGHQQGDEVLRYVGKALSENVRADDFVARYGGEEFVLILPNSTREVVVEVCEAVRAGVEATQVPYLEKPGEFLSVTASFGGISIDPAVYSVSGVSDFKVFIESSDKNLYQAKENGRNCTVVIDWKYEE